MRHTGVLSVCVLIAGAILTIATSPPYFSYTDRVDLGTLDFAEADGLIPIDGSFEVEGYLGDTIEEVFLQVSVGLENLDAESGAVRLWALEQPWELETWDPAETEDELVETLVIPGAIGEEPGAVDGVMAWERRWVKGHQQGFHLLLELEGAVDVVGSGWLTVTIGTEERQPDDVSVVLEVH